MKKYPPSIVTDDMTHCFFCKRTPVAIHHVFGGANRDKSTQYGFVVGLCPECHTSSPRAVHLNEKNNLILKRFAQKRFEKNHTREEFIKIIGKSYL